MNSLITVGFIVAISCCIVHSGPSGYYRIILCEALKTKFPGIQVNPLTKKADTFMNNIAKYIYNFFDYHWSEYDKHPTNWNEPEGVLWYCLFSIKIETGDVVVEAYSNGVLKFIRELPAGFRYTHLPEYKLSLEQSDTALQVIAAKIPDLLPAELLPYLMGPKVSIEADFVHDVFEGLYYGRSRAPADAYIHVLVCAIKDSRN